MAGEGEGEGQGGEEEREGEGQGGEEEREGEEVVAGGSRCKSMLPGLCGEPAHAICRE